MRETLGPARFMKAKKVRFHRKPTGCSAYIDPTSAVAMLNHKKRMVYLKKRVMGELGVGEVLQKE